MMTTVGDYPLGVQAWAGTSEPDPNRITVCRTGSPTSKPDASFFTSTWEPVLRSSAWLDYMRKYVERDAKREGRHIWTFQPDPAITLRVIDSEDGFRELANAHPHNHENKRNPCQPDWYGICTMARRPFDAVHVTAQAAPLLEKWGCESTLWFALERFPGLEYVGPLYKNWNLPPP
jgi:hypothetical protein